MADPRTNYAQREQVCEEAAQLAESCIRESEQQRGDLAVVWDECERLWRTESISEVFEQDEVRHVAECYNRTEIIVPRIYTGIFGVGPWFATRAREKGYERYEPTLDDFLLWELSQDDWRFFGDQDEGIRQMVIYGTVFYKCDWVRRVERVARRQMKKKEYKVGGQKIAEELVPGELELTEQSVRFPRARPLRLLNVHVDRWASYVADCRYIGDEFEKTVAEIEAMDDVVNVENVVKEPESSQRDLSSVPRELRKIRLHELWTTMSLDGEPVGVSILIGSKLDKTSVLRVKVNTFPGALKPYCVGRYIKRPGQIYGVGAIAPVRSAARELDDWRTLQMRHAELRVAPPFIVRDQAQLENEDLFLYPGRTIASPMGREGIQPIDVGKDIIGPQMEAVIRRDIAETSRAPDAWMGSGTSTRETAYEVGRRLQESSISLGRIIGRYRLEVLKPILRNFMALNAMNLDEALTIRVVGEKGLTSNPFLEIDPTNFQAQFDFDILDIAEVALTGESARAWVNFLHALPPELHPTIRWDRAMKDVLKSMGRQNPEQYVRMQPDEDNMLSAGEEILMIEQLKEPTVYPEQNHIAHVGLLQTFMGSGGYKRWTPQQKLMLERTMQRHWKYAARLLEKNLMDAQNRALGAPSPEQPTRSAPRAAPPEGAIPGLRRSAGQTQGGAM